MDTKVRVSSTGAQVSSAINPLRVAPSGSLADASGSVGLQIDPNGTMITDLAEGLGPTLNEWREAVTVIQAYELDMRGGTRYIEMLYNHYGVINPDFRLQRPEFLGSSRSMVNIHPVPQTSESNTTPQGNLSAFGTVVGGARNGFVKSFTEFGYVMGLGYLS